MLASPYTRSTVTNIIRLSGDNQTWHDKYLHKTCAYIASVKRLKMYSSLKQACRPIIHGYAAKGYGHITVHKH